MFVPMGKSAVVDELRNIAGAVQADFARERRVLSFQEYLDLFAQDPVRHSRDASTYLRDAFDHYGREEIERPWGTQERFRLFDQPFAEAGDRARDALAGQEAVQSELYRVLCNFVREGRPNRVLLLHGPNGSAKSTIAACLMRALENYSSLDEGALYRFHWIFPSQNTLRGSIGFGGPKGVSDRGSSYAHLSDDQIDARLFVELRDHPLFLLPQAPRRELIERLYRQAGCDRGPPRWLTHGGLCQKSRRIFETLLASYGGSLEEVLRHIQVERYFISRRYRIGAVTLGPQLSVDAGERQVTADRSVAGLPASLQGLALFEVFGELVDAAGGLLEYSDLLKRPLDAFKYLQITAETGEVALQTQTLQVNCVLLASGNEIHLNAFRAHPEFESFRGRLELVRVPYLRNWRDEVKIYDAQIVPHVNGHVAPHATEVAAMFAVLTRMQKPSPDKYPRELRELMLELTAVEKMDLYTDGRAPKRLDEEAAKLLRSAIPELYREWETADQYEGSTGASPREMRVVLLDAAQSRRYGYLSPFAVLDELEHLCERTSEYTFLQQERLPGGYHDTTAFREVLLHRVLDDFEDELRLVSGIVEETRYLELFDRYVTHVSYWTKGEQLRNPLTGSYEEPDRALFAEVERLLGVSDKAESFRHGLINAIAAWAIDHPDEPVENRRVYADHLRRLREAVFAERRVTLARLCRDIVLLLREEGAGLDSERRHAARSAIDALCQTYGYIDDSVADVAAVLLRRRYTELLS
jgi:predicted Ser/Thr protein kinase